MKGPSPVAPSPSPAPSALAILGAVATWLGLLLAFGNLLLARLNGVEQTVVDFRVSAERRLSVLETKVDQIRQLKVAQR